MARHIHSNYYEDNLVKYECQNCRKRFVVGEILSKDIALSCPYCNSVQVSYEAATSDELLDKLNLACMGIYFHLYDNGDFMLYNSSELVGALKDAGEQQEIFVSSIDEVMQKEMLNKFIISF